MTSPFDTYTSPLATRNASPEMLRLWSARHKFNTWRRIWLAVAEAMCEMGEQGERTRRASEGETAGNAPSAVSAKGAATEGAGRSGGAGSAGVQPLAGAARSQGPLVTREQVEELRAVVERKNPDGTVGITDDEIRLAETYERELRHDVMAHVHALGDACPKARAIIHLGMTSQDVVCNADLLIMGRAMNLIVGKTFRLVLAIGEVALRWAHCPTLGFTHYQPAQPTTVGRRIAAWAQEFMLVGEDLHFKQIRFRGLRGATGTQASFLSLLNNDPVAVETLEAKVVARLHRLQFEGVARRPKADDEWDGFDFRAANAVRDRRRLEVDREALTAGGMSQDRIEQELSQSKREHESLVSQREWATSYTFFLTGQTYPRVVDAFVLSNLASTAAVLHKIATDIRLLSNRKELDEPFEDKQIGSSAMPYKRNPMRCERICGLTRFVMNLVGNAYDTAATQWLERTLDDSSNRRLSLPEAFLALDGALDLMHNVASGLIVHEAMVRKNLMAELPFMATENILMACVRAGGDRQEYHEIIRVHAQAAGLRVKQEGLDNDLLDRLKADRAFWSKARGGSLEHELDWSEGAGGLLDPMRYVGRSVEQTERFIREVVEPLRERYRDAMEGLGQSGPRV